MELRKSEAWVRFFVPRPFQRTTFITNSRGNGRDLASIRSSIAIAEIFPSLASMIESARRAESHWTSVFEGSWEIARIANSLERILVRVANDAARLVRPDGLALHDPPERRFAVDDMIPSSLRNIVDRWVVVVEDGRAVFLLRTARGASS